MSKKQKTVIRTNQALILQALTYELSHYVGTHFDGLPLNGVNVSVHMTVKSDDDGLAPQEILVAAVIKLNYEETS